MKPLFLVISAPSGAGKTTLCDMLLNAYPELTYSISCTTRMPRMNEEDGEDYHFIPEETFDRFVREDRFLEHATVHGNSYGTLKEPIYDALKQGLCVLLDIDVKGAAQIRRKIASLPADDPMRHGFVDIFIMPPSIEELANRLRKRATDAQDVIDRRVANAQEEMSHAQEYAYQVVNDDLQTAFRRLCDIINVKAEWI